jgi:hypothetical protein
MRTPASLSRLDVVTTVRQSLHEGDRLIVRLDLRTPAACDCSSSARRHLLSLSVTVAAVTTSRSTPSSHRPAARHAACSAAVAQLPTSRNRTRTRLSYLTWTSKP